MPPFTHRGPWEIQWNAEGAIFQVYVYSATGDVVGVAANQQGAGDGASYQSKPGTYYLNVNAVGRFRSSKCRGLLRRLTVAVGFSHDQERTH